MPRRGLRQQVAGAMVASGLTTAVNRLWARRLTVLTYHRIADVEASDFDVYRRTVSATPAAFAAQLDIVCALGHPVSLDQVVAAVARGTPLPPRAVLITFDDGYRDNADVALPILRAKGVPGVVFLTTHQVDTGRPFFWDEVAWLFHHTPVRRAVLPLVGRQSLADAPSRHRVVDALVNRLKWLADDERAAAIAGTAAALQVTPPDDAFKGLYLTWPHVERAAARGLAFGSHTVTHAILPTVSATRAREELVTSRAKVSAALGQPIAAFAYPNGLADAASERLVAEAGYAVAFSTQPGPVGVSTLRRRPLAIRRVSVYRRDTLATFTTKLTGMLRLWPVGSVPRVPRTAPPIARH